MCVNVPPALYAPDRGRASISPTSASSKSRRADQAPPWTRTECVRPVRVRARACVIYTIWYVQCVRGGVRMQRSAPAPARADDFLCYLLSGCMRACVPGHACVIERERRWPRQRRRRRRRRRPNRPSRPTQPSPRHVRAHKIYYTYIQKEICKKL